MAEQTRDRIITEAARQFARRGFEGASLRSIAEAVGIRAASIFHHFPAGKAELYQAIFATVTNDVAARLAENFRADAEPVDAILLMSGLFWDLLAERRDIAALLLRDAFDEPGREHPFLAVSNDIVATARNFLVQSQQRGGVRAFDPDFFMMWSATYCVTFHGAPGFRKNLVTDEDATGERAKAQYLDAVKLFLGVAA